MIDPNLYLICDLESNEGKDREGCKMNQITHIGMLLKMMRIMGTKAFVLGKRILLHRKLSLRMATVQL